MSHVYRIIPSLPSTVKHRQKIDTGLGKIEGEFYDLGFVSFEHGWRFLQTSDEGQANIYSTNSNSEFKHFFLFPFDAVWCAFRSIERGVFSRYEWELLEYDIPDDILLQYCGYGFYSEKARVEFRIPENVFQNIPSKIVDNEELICKLLESYQSYVHQFGGDTEEFLANFNAAISIAIDKERNYYYSNFITQNRNVVSRNELFLYNENGEIIGLLDNKDLIKMLCQKRIECNNKDLDIYNYLERSSNDVYWNQKKSLVELQNELKDVLPKLSKVKKS